MYSEIDIVVHSSLFLIVLFGVRPEHLKMFYSITCLNQNQLNIMLFV